MQSASISDASIEGWCLKNDVVFGSVNANRAHYEAAAVALASAERAWLSALITRATRRLEGCG
jgi:hypothetical protein